VVEVSRRAIFRHIVGGAGFELDLDTANEVLMRANRSLDPIPVTESMWASLAAARRERRYSGGEARDAASVGDAAAGLREPVGRLRGLPDHIARDLTFLLRLENVLRAWKPPATGETPSEAVRDDILAGLAREVRRYLDECEDTEAYRHDILLPVIRCLARAARIALPPDPARLIAILTTPPPLGT
jgi:hypothetical protein